MEVVDMMMLQKYELIKKLGLMHTGLQEKVEIVVSIKRGDVCTGLAMCDRSL